VHLIEGERKRIDHVGRDQPDLVRRELGGVEPGLPGNARAGGDGGGGLLAPVIVIVIVVAGLAVGAVVVASRRRRRVVVD